MRSSNITEGNNVETHLEDISVMYQQIKDMLENNTFSRTAII